MADNVVMSQWQRILEFVKTASDPSADLALIHGLRRAEEPFKSQLLEAILDRGQADATEELVQNFHTCSAQWQLRLIDKVSRLHSGLRRAGSSGDKQYQLNALEIIHHANYDRLTDMVVTLLRHREPSIVHKAGQVMVALGTRNGMVPWNTFDHKNVGSPSKHQTLMLRLRNSQQNNNQTHSHRIYLSALEMALRNYKLHGRPEAILAAMCAVPANAADFWRETLSSYEPIGKTARKILLKENHKELAAFCLSSLEDDDLRTTAVRALSVTKPADYIGRAADYFVHHTTENIRYGLSLVKSPMWLDASHVRPDGLDDNTQVALVRFVLALGVAREDQIQYLSEMGARACLRGAGKAIDALIGFKETTLHDFERLLQSPHEMIAVKVMQTVLQHRSEQRKAWSVMALKSRHEQVRQMAVNELRRFVVRDYWNNFEHMDKTARVTAGQAIHKIEPTAVDSWLSEARHGSADRRLRAVQIAREMEKDSQWNNMLLELSGDSDPRVRATAIAALGESPAPLPTATEQQLLWAIKDSDARVRANAIEAMGNHGAKTSSRQIIPFVKSNHNRERTNAIHALLNWKVKSAKKAVTQLLADPREDHRRSGSWLVGRIEQARQDETIGSTHHKEIQHATPMV
jgi:hypothetical protein